MRLDLKKIGKNILGQLFPDFPHALITIFLLLFFLFCGIFILPSIINVTLGRNFSPILWVSFLAALSLFILIIGYSYSAHSKNKKMIFFGYPLMITFFTILTRGLVIIVMGQGTQQISDFASAIRVAESLPEITSHHQVFSTWLLHAFYLRFIPTEFVGIIMNMVFTALSAVTIYFICILSDLRTEVGLLSALLFLAWPAYLFYTIIITPEFIFVFLILLAMLLVVIGRKKAKENKVLLSVVLFVVAGIMAGVSAFFKQFHTIFIVAYVIILLLSKWSDFIKQRKAGNTKKKEAFQIRKIFRFEIVLAALMIVAVLITTSLVYTGMERYTGKHLNRSVLPHTLYIGLTGNGRWSAERSIYIDVVEDSQMDFAVARERMFSYLREYIEENDNLTYDFFRMKLNAVWAENSYMGFVNRTMNEESAFAPDVWNRAVRPLMHYYYMLLMGFFVLSALLVAFKSRDKLIVVSHLVVFGTLLLLLVAEAQPRYITVIYPVMAINSAYGVNGMVEIVKKRAGRIRKKNG